MAQNRRADDMSVQLLSEKFDAFVIESREWRAIADKEQRANAAAIKCLADHFIKYKPQLEEGLNRRRWWAKFWEERRQELITYTVRATAATLFGLVVYAMYDKAVAWVRSLSSGT